ncbi:MAG: hypothetical protein RJA36_1918 [Pseudomonadota bacterium]|jgi:hypothetical protein
MSAPTEKSITHHDAFGWYEGDSATFLDHRAIARVSVACEAIQTLTAVLMQREIDGSDEFTVMPLKLDHRVAMGMLNAVACCAELVKTYATGIDAESVGATSYPASSPGAELMRETARKAATMRRARDRGNA